MIRMIQRRLIIPCGDTGSFSIPVNLPGTFAIFTILDPLTRTVIFKKIFQVQGEILDINFTYNDTINLKPGKYLWDIQLYVNPQFDEDNELIHADSVNSYYAGFSLPVCEIRETADSYASR